MTLPAHAARTATGAGGAAGRTLARALRRARLKPRSWRSAGTGRVRAVGATAAITLLLAVAVAVQVFPRAEPSSGVYAGPCAVDEVAGFAQWRGRSPELVVDTLDMRRWSNIATPVFWTECWGPETSMVYGVALVTSEDGGSLARGAAGAYDETFRDLAETLVAGGQGDAWLRLGFEFNGDWFPWTAADDPGAFAAYHRRVVDVMREVPGADFSFVWNPTVGLEAFPAEQAWPGGDHVDAIGLDLYDSNFDPAIYPIPAGATPQERRARHEAAWERYVTMDHGLDWWVRFAEQEDKPLALPEWGLVGEQDNGGGDNPLFVERVHAWVQEHEVVFEAYFDAVGAGGDHRLRSGDYPEAAATYRRLFGQPNP